MILQMRRMREKFGVPNRSQLEQYYRLAERT